MPTYVYGCSDKEHPTSEIIHRMTDVVDIRCAKCGKAMHRIPQRSRFYMNPVDVLYQKIERGDFSRKTHERILNNGS